MKARIDEPAWVAALRQPAAYPSGVETVEFVETHISWLFFAGERVFKTKKPVDLGFLDYSTLERRHLCCAEEVRLNRRLAPDSYLGVTPVVRRDSGAYAFGGEGEVVDWAVEMRRLPAARMLDRLLASGDVEAARIDALADVLVRFHRHGARGDEVAAWARPAAIAAPVRDNFEQTRQLAGEVIPPGWHAFAESGAQRMFAELAPVFERRAAEGRAVEGHGDLHAGNICFDSAGIVVYDCIEFSMALRCSDVAADLAFLLMDLEYRGWWPLARQLLDRYVRCSGDAGVPALMPFYKSYRAMVRAKVAGIRLAEGGPPAVLDEARRQAAGYCQLAAIYALGPVLVLTCGLPGSGKSWAAGHLGRALLAAVLRSDVLRKQQAREDADPLPTGVYGGGLYSAERRDAVYAQLAQQAAEQMRAGRSVVVDASFSRRRWRRRFVDLARSLGRPLLLLQLQPDAERIRIRLQDRVKRGDDASDADVGIFEAAKDDFEPPLEMEPAACCRIGDEPEPEFLVSVVTDRLLAQASQTTGRQADEARQGDTR